MKVKQHVAVRKRTQQRLLNERVVARLRKVICRARVSGKRKVATLTEPRTARAAAPRSSRSSSAARQTRMAPREAQGGTKHNEHVPARSLVETETYWAHWICHASMHTAHRALVLLFVRRVFRRPACQLITHHSLT